MTTPAPENLPANTPTSRPADKPKLTPEQHQALSVAKAASPRRRGQPPVDEQALLAELGMATAPSAEPAPEPVSVPDPEAFADPLPFLPDPSPQELRAVGAILAPLKPTHARFVQLHVAGKRPAEAARLSGLKGHSRNTAKRLLARSDVKEAIAALHDLAVRRSVYDFDQASTELAQARAFALKTGNAMAVTRAIELRAKLHGHLNDRLDVRAVGDVAFKFVMSPRKADDPGTDQSPLIEHEAAANG